MHEFETVLADARRLEKGAAPRHTAKQYEDAMCDLAESEAREGESVRRAAAEREDLGRVARSEEPLTKRVRTRELAYSLMTSFAKDRAQEGESAEDAMARLMGEGDPPLRELYEIYSGA